MPTSHYFSFVIPGLEKRRRAQALSFNATIRCDHPNEDSPDVPGNYFALFSNPRDRLAAPANYLYRVLLAALDFTAGRGRSLPIHDKDSW